MKKITLALVVVVAAALLTATALGFQNGAAPESQNVVPEPPEYARDNAINYILQAHQELGALQVPSCWATENLTPGFLGASNLRYTADRWNVTVSYPVVLEPTYTVEINFTGETGFQWTGTATQDGNIAETGFTLTQ